MSSAGYDAALPSSSFSNNDYRYTLGSVLPAYDRSPPASSRRRTPSPSRRYIPYDSYVPPRSAPAYREDYSNVYRPNVYRPDPSSTYHNRSPSPDRYVPSRLETNIWDRSFLWQSPVKTPARQDKKAAPPSPTTSISRDRVRRDTMLATRMFEPSDAWKQTHVDRPTRMGVSRPPSVDRYSDYPKRDIQNVSPDRHERSSLYYTGDRYRPAQPYRDSYVNGRSEYDSYRPTWAPSSSLDGIGKGPLGSSNRHEYNNRRVSRPVSISGSISPRSRPRSSSYRRRETRRSPDRGRRSRSPNHSPYDSDSSVNYRHTLDPNELSAKKSRSRSSSRSSIASTHVSDMVPSPVHNNTTYLPQPEEFIEAKLNAGITANASVVCSPTSPQTSTLAPKDDDSKVLKSPRTPNSPYHVSQEHTPKLQSDFHIIADTSVQPPRVASPESTLVMPQSPVQANAQLMSYNSDFGHDISSPHIQSPKVQIAKDLSVPLLEPRYDNFSSSTTSIHAPRVTHSSSSDLKELSRATPPTEGVDPIPVLRADDTAAVSCPKPLFVLQTPNTDLPVDYSPVLEGFPEHIPNLSDARTTAEALRIVVMTRLLCDRQSREERVGPVLAANNATAAQSFDTRPSATPSDVIKGVAEGKPLENRLDTFALVKDTLVQRLRERQVFMSEKVQRLQEEYLSLHERWLVHCASLDEQSKPIISAESETLQPPGRTTRRSTANLGDAVRSDLEMEQIIASLGNDEATDPNQLSARNLATIPDMVSVTRGKVDYVFDDTNHLVGNPSEYYGPHTGIHDWTEAEREIFLDKFAAHPKQFGIIADYIPNKTAAQCVDYYYLHKKKFIDFRKVISQYAPNKRRRRGTGKKKGNGLLADIRQHDAEMYRDSESPSFGGRTTRGRRAMPPPEPKKPIANRRTAIQTEGTPASTPTPEPETKPRRRRAVLPSSRTVSVSLEDAEEEGTDAEARPAKRAKRNRKVKPVVMITEGPRAPIPETRFIDQNESTSRRKPQPVAIQWSHEDKTLFLGLLGQHGDDFKRIAASMPNKTTIQVSNYYKANLVDMDLEKVAAGAPKRSPTPRLHESRKHSPYPGSGIMSPVVGASLELVPPMSSLSQEGKQGSLHKTPPITPSELPKSSVSADEDWKSHTSWVTITSRGIPTAPVIRTSVPGSVKQPETARNSSHPLTPSQVRSSPVVYPVPIGSLSNDSYASNSVPPPPPPPPSFSSTRALPYTYPSFPDTPYPPYESRIDQRSVASRSSDPHAPLARRLPGVPSIHRGENPYPVLPSPGAPPTSYYYSSLRSS